MSAAPAPAQAVRACHSCRGRRPADGPVFVAALSPLLQVVNYGFGVSTYNALKELGADVDFKTYRGMGHSAMPSELAAVSAFLKKVLPPA
jgi:predicted esterase